MHFTIGDTEEGRDSLGASYVVYGIHLEGLLFCKVRYSQLHRWNEKLRRHFGSNHVPDFPPKNYLAQTESMAEKRRLQLQEYLQKVGEDPVISASEIFTTLLTKAQQETFKIHLRAILLEIFLADGKKLLINTHTCDTAERMLAIAAEEMELSREYLEYFALYLACEHPNGGHSVLRKLNAFELPYLCRWSLPHENSRIMIRPSYLDPLKDRILMGSIAGVLLLYSQATYELEKGWVRPTPEQYQQLKAFQEAEKKREFLELMEEVKFHGYLQFEDCTCDYPEPNCTVAVRVGNDEINICIQLPSNHIKETSFKVSRIRCWRISVQTPLQEEMEVKPELSFEYQDSQDSWRWVTICTQQAFLLGRCMKEMSVDKPKLAGNHAEMHKQSGVVRQKQHKQVTSKDETSVFEYIAEDQL